MALLCGIGVGTLMIKNNLKEEKSLIPVNEPVLNTVVSLEKDNSIIKPYFDTTVSLLNGFYDYRSEEDRQLNSIIFYDNTYMQNKGNIYVSDNKFDVVAIADGEIVKIEDSSLSGKMVTIKHSYDIVSIYQFLESVDVSPSKMIKKGEKIGVSGISNIVDNTKNQLYFELLIHGKLVDAEEYYGKNINEL